MRKYFAVVKVLFKAQLIYRFEIAFQMLLTVVKILFALIVWGAIFGEHETVAGFTLAAMLSYYVFNAFLSQLEMSGGVSGEIAGRIRNGTFSKFMVVPIHVEGYFHAQNYGAAGLYMIFNLAAATIWVLAFRIELVFTQEPTLLVGAGLMVVMGLVFMVQLNFFLGILAFRFHDIRLFLMIKSNLVAFATGGFVPLALLPGAVLATMRLFPFYYVSYLPSMLLLGRNGPEIRPGLLTLGLWMAALWGVNRVAYGALRRRYDGVGI